MLFQSSCVGTPQQNGQVERKHRYILEDARALQFQASLPIEFWGECEHATTYLINRTPTKLIKGKTPHELLFGSPPSHSTLELLDAYVMLITNPVSRTNLALEVENVCFLVGTLLERRGGKYLI